MGEVLTVKEAAMRLKVSQRTVRDWLAVGRLTGYRMPGTRTQAIIRVDSESIQKFLNATRMTA